MKKLEEAKYCITPEEFKPDANLILRFITTFQTEISAEEIQTADGVVSVPQKYEGPKLSHGDKIQVIGRKLMNGRYEGQVKKVSQRAYWQFKEYLHILANPQAPNIQKVERPVEQSFFGDEKKP